MKKFLLVLFAAFMVFNCSGRRLRSRGRRCRFRVRHHHTRKWQDKDFFKPHTFLVSDQKKTQLQLSISRDKQELEKSQLRHQIEMEKLKQQQLNQRYQIEKENLRKRLELLKMQKEIRELEKK